jgi:hypothetical protein
LRGDAAIAGALAALLQATAVANSFCARLAVLSRFLPFPGLLRLAVDALAGATLIVLLAAIAAAFAGSRSSRVRESGADGASGGQDGTNTLAAVPQDVQVSDEVVESLVVHDGSPVNVGSKDGQCREGSLSLRVTGRVGSMQLK